MLYVIRFFVRVLLCPRRKWEYNFDMRIVFYWDETCWTSPLGFRHSDEDKNGSYNKSENIVCFFYIFSYCLLDEIIKIIRNKTKHKHFVEFAFVFKFCQKVLRRVRSSWSRPGLWSKFSCSQWCELFLCLLLYVHIFFHVVRIIL